MASLATLGPHVYAFGGVNYANPSTREVPECYRLRITPQVGKEFVPVSPMVSGRCSSEISVLGNKIYLRNSSSQTDLLNHCWGEVFDVHSGKWEALPNPPNYPVQYPESIFLSAVVENPERVIVAYRASYNSTIFYAYNVRDRYWGKLSPARRWLHDHVRDDSWPGNCVSAGNTLYWIKREKALKDDLLFIAYDLDLDMWLEGCLKGHGMYFFQDCGYLDGDGFEGSHPGFFHLEKQRFCLLQFGEKADYIRCVVVHVSPMRRMKALDIEVVCDRKYAMEPTICPAFAFCDVVPKKIDNLEEISTNKEARGANYGIRCSLFIPCSYAIILLIVVIDLLLIKQHYSGACSCKVYHNEVRYVYQSQIPQTILDTTSMRFFTPSDGFPSKDCKSILHQLGIVE